MQTTRPNIWKTYIGSGHALQNAIKKYGKENFQKVIISFANSDDELNQQEMDLINFLNAVEDKNYYNISNGLYCNPWTNKTKEEQEVIKIKIRLKSRKNILSEEEYYKYINNLSQKMTGKNNPFYGKHHTEKSKSIISQKASIRQLGDKNNKPWLGVKGSDNPRYGTFHSEESKKKMSESAKNKFKNGFIHG